MDLVPQTHTQGGAAELPAGPDPARGRRRRATAPRRGARRRLPAALPHGRAAAARAGGRRRAARVRVSCARACGHRRAPARRRDRPADRGRGARARARRGRGCRVLRPRRLAGRRKFPLMFITFLTDFGLADDFVGTCHGVLKRIAPDAQIIDITHGIRRVTSCRRRSCSRTRFRTCRSASTSRSSIPASAAAGARSRCATRRGGCTSAPTTGSSCPPRSASAASSRRTSSRTLTYALDSVSRTFHGRDLFSPAAAHLALGVSLARARAAGRSRSARAARPAAARGRAVADPRDGARGRPLREHRAQPRREHLDAIGIVPGMRVELARARQPLLRGRGPHVRGRAAG